MQGATRALQAPKERTPRRPRPRATPTRDHAHAATGMARGRHAAPRTTARMLAHYPLLSAMAWHLDAHEHVASKVEQLGREGAAHEEREGQLARRDEEASQVRVRI